MMDYYVNTEKHILVGTVLPDEEGGTFIWVIHPSEFLSSYVGEEVIDGSKNEFLWIDFLTMVNTMKWDLGVFD